MTTVAVTGATGFIGGRIIRLLLETGHEVRALTRRGAVSSTDGIHWCHGAMDQRGALHDLCSGVDAVVHCAGLVKARSRDEFFAANARAVSDLATVLAEAAPAARLIHMSSLAAREPLLSDYTASKAAGEDVLRRGGTRPGWTILRPPAVYGPGDREILKLFKSLRFGLAFLPGGGHGRVSVIHVDDLAAAVLAVLAAPAPAVAGRVFELDDGRPGGYSLREIYAIAAEVTGRSIRNIPVAPQVLTFAAQANRAIARFRGQAPMVTPGKVAELLHPDWVAQRPGLNDSGLWQPQIALRDGLAATFEWYRAERYL